MTLGQVLTWVLVALAALAWLAWRWLTTPQERARIRDAERQQKAARRDAAAEQPKQLVCPHCQTRGHVTVRIVSRKKGISGGKATGAILTGGASMLATGLSRKEPARQMSCGNCGTTWDVA